MIGEQPIGGAGALDAGLQIGIPPDVVNVDGDTQARPAARRELIAQRVRLCERVDAGAIRRVHRVQRLDRERHAGSLRVQEQLADAVANHFARALQILRHDFAVAPFWKTADDEHEAARAERGGLVDGATIVVACRAAIFAIGGGKHAAAAKPGDRQARVANALRRFLETRGGNLVAPRRDAANPVSRATRDDFGQRPLHAYGRRVE